MKNRIILSLAQVICFWVSLGMIWETAKAQKECNIAVVEKKNPGDNSYVVRAWNELVGLGTMLMVEADDLVDIQLKVKEEYDNRPIVHAMVRFILLLRSATMPVRPDSPAII